MKWLRRKSLQHEVAEMRKEQAQFRVLFETNWRELMDKMQSLIDEVAKVKGVEDSALTFITGLKQQLADALAAVAAGAPASTQIQNIIDALETNSAPLAAAVATPPAT